MIGYCLRILLVLLFIISLDLANAQNNFVLQVPPSPSSDIHVFQKQFLEYNATKLSESLQKNEPSTKTIIAPVENVYNQVNNSATISPSNPDDKFKLEHGIILLKGKVYTNVLIKDYRVNNTYYLIKKHYTCTIPINHVSLEYNRFFNGLNTYGISLSKSW